MTLQITVYPIEYFDERFYRINIPNQSSEYFASVTTKQNAKAKLFLKRWYGDLGNREADLRVWEAGERGKRIHSAWYTFVTGGVVIYQPWNRDIYSKEQMEKLKSDSKGNFQVLRSQDEMLQLHKLQTIFKALNPKVIESEKIVYSLKHRDAGTIDNIFDIKAGTYRLGSVKPLVLPQGMYVVDVKSGNIVDNDVWLQMAPYSRCYEEMGLGSPIGALVFHTGSKTKTGYNVLYRSKKDLNEDYDDYRHVAAIWERDNRNAAPRYLEFPSLISMKGERYAKISTPQVR